MMFDDRLKFSSRQYDVLAKFTACLLSLQSMPVGGFVKTEKYMLMITVRITPLRWS